MQLPRTRSLFCCCVAITMLLSLAHTWPFDPKTGLAAPAVTGGETAEPQAFQATGSWSSQASGTAQRLNGVHFVNANLGWIVGDAGTLRVSYDGGETWTPQSPGTQEDLRDVYFINSSVGWVVGSEGTVLHTRDGGQTWSPQNSGTTMVLTAVKFVDAHHGWAVGSKSTLLHTTDGGTNWQTQSPPADGHTCSSIPVVDFWDTQRGWLACWAAARCTDPGGGVHATVDGGQTWVYRSTGDLHYTTGVDFINATSGWALGYRYLGDQQYAMWVFQSTDGADTWTEIAELSGYSGKVHFVDATYGWLTVHSDNSGYRSRIFASEDGGSTWSPQYNAALYLTDLYMLDARSGWAVGESGTLLRYTTPPATLALNYNTGQPGSYFTLTGAEFYPSSDAVVTVNGHLLGTITTDASGNFSAILDTGPADVGHYSVNVRTGPVAAGTRCVLDDSAPLRPQEGSGPVLQIPGGIAFTHLVYLPAILR